MSGPQHAKEAAGGALKRVASAYADTSKGNELLWKLVSANDAPTRVAAVMWAARAYVSDFFLSVVLG